MADKTNNLTIWLKEVADAIRYVKSIEGEINPQDFAALILSLSKKILGTIDTENTITLLSNMLADDTYTLRYNDASNNAIENFADICTLTVAGSDVQYPDFINVNIPPYLAECIGIYNSAGERIGMIDITKFKPSFGTRLYRFGLLSDVHDYEGSSAEPSEDFQTALSLFNEKEDVVMTCICGDISQNGTESEFEMFQDDVLTKSPDTPVYTTTGNHDCGSGGGQIDESLWSAYTGQKLTFEISKTLDNGSIDHFLFLGMTSWSLGSDGTPYNEANIDWLESKLNEYKNDRCFVFTHLFFPERAGNLNDIYPSYNWLQGSQLTRLQGLCDKYVNSVWFSGHSHWKWYLQKYQDRANIYRSYNNDTPTCGWCVHVPSCASPIDSNGSTRVEKPLESEGGVIDIYENYIDIRGIDLKNNLYLPIATYRLDTTIYEISDEETNAQWIYLTDANFAKSNDEYINNGIDYEGNVTTCPTVTWNDETETLTITFDNHSQKLICYADILESTTLAEDIRITTDNVTYYINGVDITNNDTYASAINGVGFYLEDGYYSINVPNDEGTLVKYDTTLNDPTQNNGCNLQFNISNSKYETILNNANVTEKYPLSIEIVRPKLIIGG